IDNYNLSELIISKNPISDDGIKLISKGIIHNMTLKRLHIDKTNMTIVGEKYIENALKNNRTLYHLIGTKSEKCGILTSNLGVLKRMTDHFLIQKNESILQKNNKIE